MFLISDLLNLLWLALIIGLMFFFWKIRSDEKFTKRMIKYRNESDGVVTKITPLTIKWTKISATAGLILGAIMIFMFFSSL